MWADARRLARMRLAPLRARMSRRRMWRVRRRADEALLLRPRATRRDLWRHEARRPRRRVHDAGRRWQRRRNLVGRVCLLGNLRRLVRLRSAPVRRAVSSSPRLGRRAPLPLLARLGLDVPVRPNSPLDPLAVPADRLHGPRPDMRQDVLQTAPVRTRVPVPLPRRTVPVLSRTGPPHVPVHFAQDDSVVRRTVPHDPVRSGSADACRDGRVPVREGVQSPARVREAPVREGVLPARVPGGVHGGQEGQETRHVAAGSVRGTGTPRSARVACLRQGLRSKTQLYVSRLLSG